MSKEKDNIPAEGADKRPDGSATKPVAKKHGRLWLRVPLYCLLALILLVVAVPVLLYVPAVQEFAKNVACKVVRDKTGMDISIGRFGLKFPLDVSLQNVSVVEATGDTMVRAGEVIADVKLLPLLHLDVDIKRLSLLDGYYRMVSPDSSMIMAVRAKSLVVGAGSSANLGKSEILLDEAEIKGGYLSLYMNVWRQQQQPVDTTTTPFLIKARRLQLEDFTFAMSMLPTIDTLRFNTRKLMLEDGIVDLRSNNITASLLKADGGSMRYLVPTPEYVASHPVPVDTLATPSAPITIKADSISLDGFDVLYATKGVRPAPGFDAGYIQLSDVAVGLRDFYNQASTVVLPVTKLRATERCGLDIVSGSGTVKVDSTGLELDNLLVTTPFSRISATAGVPFALMEMQPQAPLRAQADVVLGMPDIDAFMPDLKTYTRAFNRNPLRVSVVADGRLDDVTIEKFDMAIDRVLALKASGRARNVLDVDKLAGELTIDGRVTNPAPLEGLAGDLGFHLPAFTLRGKASAQGKRYAADMKLLTSQGDLLADGHVNLNAESYSADVSAGNLNVAHFLPDLGVGKVSARIKADGAGFNPSNPRMHTNADVNIASIEYNGCRLHDITAHASLLDGLFSITAESPNSVADLMLNGSGRIEKDTYEFDVTADVRSLDLKALGLDTALNNVRASFAITGTANPANWLYDVKAKVTDLVWNLPGQTIELPAGVSADVVAQADYMKADIVSDMTEVSFESPTGLKHLIDSFTAFGAAASSAVEKRELPVDSLSRLLPEFTLNASASGRGALQYFIAPSGLGLDTVWMSLRKDSLLNGNVNLLGLSSGSIATDTLRLDLKERGQMLDYALHMGNRPGTLDEFAQVDMRGYAGMNRVALMLRQRNIADETGYRVGLTGALVDDVATIHFTPLKSVIAYLPWTFNADNIVEVNLKNYRVKANLSAASAESSITLKTQDGLDGKPDELHLNLTNIKVQDFLKMSVYAPPLTATVNTDLRVAYDGDVLHGSGALGIRDFTYDKVRVGDFDLDVKAGLEGSGRTRALAGLRIDGKPALTAYSVLRSDSTGIKPDSLGVRLTRFPIAIANAFVGTETVRMGGWLNGEMRMGGTFMNPLLNGEISCDSVNVFIPMMGSTLRFDNTPLTVRNSVVNFNDFDIWAANENSLKINGNVDASKFSDVGIDMSLDANNFQLIGNDKRSKSELYGKLFLNMQASAKGKLSLLDINGSVNVLGATDVTYNLPATASTMATQQSEQGVVRFVNFNDSTQMVKADSVAPSMMMRINAALTITPGAQVVVNLSNNGTDKAQLSPSGTLRYYQNFMGDMTLNGQLTLGSGFVRYSILALGEKMFEFDPSSYVHWNGAIMNPVLNIKAWDEVKANIQQNGGNTRVVNFLVNLAATGTLSQPKLTFDLSTNDDLTIQNELQSMTPDQRSQQAMNLLLYGQYTGAGTKTVMGPLTGNLYNFLASQVNSWAAKNIRGVDLSFGVDQYDQRQDGREGSSMSYSYQVSKSLFNNRFKISVGGNYATDASADENLSQNLISDISFEYMIKQSQSYSMLVKLFRHNDYESILEGEITETGVGFVMKRKLGDMRRLFRFGNRRRNQQRKAAAAAADSTAKKEREVTPEK